MNPETIEKPLEFNKVNLHLLNPKSITIKTLYGDVDSTGEWHDGITAIIFRECLEEQSKDL